MPNCLQLEHHARANRLRAGTWNDALPRAMPASNEADLHCTAVSEQEIAGKGMPGSSTVHWSGCPRKTVAMYAVSTTCGTTTSRALVTCCHGNGTRGAMQRHKSCNRGLNDGLPVLSVLRVQAGK